PAAGTVKELRVKMGDKVSEGSVILTLDAAAAGASAGQKTPPAPVLQSGANAGRAPSASTSPKGAGPAPGAAKYSGKADIECEMIVLGSGPGGYSAAFRSADLGMKTVLVERYPTLGGVCLNVGCIPSKALLHIAAVMDEAASLAEHGIAYTAPKVDLDKLRAWKNKVVGKLTGGLAGGGKARQGGGGRGDGSVLGAKARAGEPTRGAGAEKNRGKKGGGCARAVRAAR